MIVQCVQGAYGEFLFDELDEIFYTVQPKSFLKTHFSSIHLHYLEISR